MQTNGNEDEKKKNKKRNMRKCNVTPTIEDALIDILKLFSYRTWQ